MAQVYTYVFKKLMGGDYGPRKDIKKIGYEDDIKN